MYYKNIIIGAGPAGVQLAYFYEKNKINYIVLEGSEHCASFFYKYPHSSKLISINKKYTGKDNADFNMRHDWNSLLNDESFLFNEYTDEFYPESKYLYEYINKFQEKNNLNIKFNSKVNKINKTTNNEYKIILDNEEYICKNLVIATGLSKMNKPNYRINTKKEIKHYGEFEKDFFLKKENLEKYKNKKLLIIGSGNAGYELANILNNYTSSILMFGKPRDFSIVSHYAGDLRSIYYPFLDTFFLKSLNAIDHISYEENSFVISGINEVNEIDNKNYGKLYLTYNNNKLYENDEINYYDEIILCTGWKFNKDIFGFNVNYTINDKYPEIKPNFESINNENLFFIGSIMHSIDYRKSSGGFIHGFRYLIKLFVQINHNNLFPFEIKKFKFNGTLDFYEDLCSHILYRINNSASLYQMFGTMCDLFYYDKNSREIIYYNNLTKNYINNMMKDLPKFYNIVQLDYGEKQYDIRKISNFNKYNPAFIHPEILIVEKDNEKIKLNDKIIIEEDLFADFTNKKYQDKIIRTIKGCNLII